MERVVLRALNDVEEEGLLDPICDKVDGNCKQELHGSLQSEIDDQVKGSIKALKDEMIGAKSEIVLGISESIFNLSWCGKQECCTYGEDF